MQHESVHLGYQAQLLNYHFSLAFAPEKSVQKLSVIDLRRFVFNAYLLVFQGHVMRIDKVQQFVVQLETLVFRITLEDVVEKAVIDDAQVGTLELGDEDSILIRR